MEEDLIDYWREATKQVWKVSNGATIKTLIEHIDDLQNRIDVLYDEIQYGENS